MRSISPLRYPGGKSKLYFQIKNLIDFQKHNQYAEPFSGGFGIGLLLLKNNEVDKVYINDLDKNIFSFWKLVTTDFLFMKKNIDKISKFNSLLDWIEERVKQKKILMSKSLGYKKRGFATFFLNRVNISGILDAGPIGGINQNGNYKINCRFNSVRLLSQLEWIYSMKDKISITNDNYDVFMNKLPKNTFIFLDPPYVDKGKHLYMNNFSKKDHENLKKFLENVPNNWILTYDNNDLIRLLYSKSKWKIAELNLNYHAGKYKIGSELLISNV